MKIRDTLLVILGYIRYAHALKGKFVASCAILILFFTSELFSKDYYFSSTVGSDSYTATQAQDPATPWKTIDKLNSSMSLLNPGDQILFKRGEVFTGQILITQSGTESARIVFSAYGTGDLPVISGTVPISGWTRYSGNIWQADCPQLSSNVTGFYINGESQQIGRYPNADSPNKGYLNIDSHAGSTSISSLSLSSSPNWTGGEAVVRTRAWLLDRILISAHSGNSIVLGRSTTMEVLNNFGFFIQNHLSTLDQDGEWYFNPANKKFYLYFSSDPRSLNTEATAFESNIQIENKQYLSIQNLELIGSLNSGINIKSSANIQVINNIVSNSGNDAVHIIDCNYVQFNNNEVYHTNNNGLVFLRNSNAIVNDNKISNIGLSPGMNPGYFFDLVGGFYLEFIGIFIDGTNIECARNEIDKVGYHGLFFNGDEIYVKNNFINNFCNSLEDGGGIYTYNERKILHSLRKIEGNIVLNGVGSPEGTNNPPGFRQVNGIYLDYGTDHVTVLNNTVANCPSFGIFNSFSHHNSITGNTLFNNNAQLSLSDRENPIPSPVTDCIVKENILYSKSGSQTILELRANRKEDIARFGIFDNNYYCRPVKNNDIINLVYPGDSPTGYVHELFDLKSWQEESEKDLNSVVCPYTLPIYSILEIPEANRISNGTFNENISSWNCWSPYGNCFASWEVNNALDGGCLKAGFSSSSGESDGSMFIAKKVNEIEAGGNYILKFSITASNPEKRIKIMMRDDPSKNSIALDKYFLANTVRNDYQFLFTADSSVTDARIDFVFTEDGTSYWIDNVEFYKAEIEFSVTEDSILFVYNPTSITLTINDGKNYVDVRGIKYPGSITLLPYSSAILIKDTDPSAPPATPVYVSSSVENSNPSVIEITYNLALANIIPANSAFSVQVNSSARPVNSVTVSGTKVLLTLSYPVAYGDVVTLTYTVPSSNALQTPAGGKADVLSARPVLNRVNPLEIPVFVGAVVENASPSILEITYSLSLANIVPAASAFAVVVNSNARTVGSVAISGTKVLLTLSSPVAYGDLITVGYMKPSTNPIQTAAGGQAATITALTVTNKLASLAVPVYVSSSIENAAPSILEMTYNLALANIIPANSAFSVQVNSSARPVNSVTVSGTKVLLTLSYPVAFGDIVTLTYTVPSSNALQTAAGGQAATITAQAVTNKVASLAVPVYVSSSIENAAPSILEMTYNLSLDNIVPAASAFAVVVNSNARTINSVAVSGTKVLLTLSSPVAYGDVVTVAYTKPSTNPIQTATGGQAATITAQAVTNKIAANAVPVYMSSVVENSTPSILEIAYNLSLGNIVPAASTFNVMVNAVKRNVSKVSISGTNVYLTLSSPIVYGDAITFTYTKPSINPLQSASGVQAASLNVQSVRNNVTVVNSPPVIVVNFQSSSYSGFVSEINAGNSYDTNKDNLSFTWKVPGNIPVSSTNNSRIEFLAPILDENQTFNFTLTVSDGKVYQSKTIPVTIIPYHPDLETAEIISVEAVDFQSPYNPYNIIDGNIGTIWSALGDDQWIILELSGSFDIQHVKLAFQSGQNREFYFDILGSNDKVNWEPILSKSKSCAFSGDLQVFEFPPSKTEKEFRYIKLIGLGNSTDKWNHIAEIKIYGYRHKNPINYEDQIVKIYPNPAHELVNILIDEPTFTPDFIKILSMAGKIIYRNNVDPGTKQFQVPLHFKQGVYIIQIGVGNITMFTQKLIVI